LDLLRAQEIVAAINSFGFATIGIESKHPFSLDELRAMDLSEMLDAVATVKIDDGARLPDENGLRRFHIVPDDRLTEAVYAVTLPDKDGIHFLMIGVRDAAGSTAEEDAA
jgi:hypothetical protein